MDTCFYCAYRQATHGGVVCTLHLHLAVSSHYASMQLSAVASSTGSSATLIVVVVTALPSIAHRVQHLHRNLLCGCFPLCVRQVRRPRLHLFHQVDHSLESLRVCLRNATTRPRVSIHQYSSVFNSRAHGSAHPQHNSVTCRTGLHRY